LLALQNKFKKDFIKHHKVFKCSQNVLRVSEALCSYIICSYEKRVYGPRNVRSEKSVRSKDYLI